MAKYDEQFKLKVVREYLKGTESGRSVAARHELDHSVVRRWVESYRVHGLAGLRRQSGTYSAPFKQ
ncbi:helix-turn-helix domain-containing protein, partial [Achromobacter sp. UMC46]